MPFDPKLLRPVGGIAVLLELRRRYPQDLAGRKGHGVRCNGGRGLLYPSFYFDSTCRLTKGRTIPCALDGVATALGNATYSNTGSWISRIDSSGNRIFRRRYLAIQQDAAGRVSERFDLFGN